MQNLTRRILGLSFRVLGFRVLGCRVWSLEFRVLVFRDQILPCQVAVLAQILPG